MGAHSNLQAHYRQPMQAPIAQANAQATTQAKHTFAGTMALKVPLGTAQKIIVASPKGGLT